MIDARKRALAKAFTWRLVAIVLLGIITYLLTNDLKTVTYVTLFYHGLQVFIFFLHERVWNYVKWGKTKGLFIQMTGLSGSGKTTLSRAVAEKLHKEGYKVELIDGDEYRTELCNDLGFSKEDRNQNIRRLGFVGKVLARNNVVAIMAAINPYQEIRNEVKQLGPFVKTVHMDCDIETLIDRDPKGLYKRALSGEIKNFTGISDPFERPEDPDLIINTADESLEESVERLYGFIIRETDS
jgi:adenylylsulfate kinase